MDRRTFGISGFSETPAPSRYTSAANPYRQNTEFEMINIKKIDILDGLELKEATFKDKHFPTHFHDTYSIGVIKNGIENLKIRDNNYIATPKTIVIINNYELHSNSFYNNDNWTYQTINLNSDALDFLSKKTIQKTNDNFVFQNLIEDDFLFNMITNFHQASNFNSYSQISEISKYLIQNYLAEKEADKLNYPNWGHIILEIKNLLDCHMDDKINIERMAKKYNKTSFQLIRAFKAHTGLTPIAYLILIRLNKAKKLLASGNTLIDTALECGFFDQSHFANCFKKYFGVSPKQYSENFSNLKIE